MSRADNAERARQLKVGLEHHLRDTMEQFGETIEAQAEACREELAHALADTGQRLSSSVTLLRRRLRERAEHFEEGAAKATAAAGQDLMYLGQRLSAHAEAPTTTTTGGVERSRHRVPGSHVEITAPLQMSELTEPQSEFVHPEPQPEEQLPPEARHPRDSQAA